MKKKGYEKYMEKKKMLSGKKIVGIDPAKERHQVAVLDEEGMQRGKSFTFPVSCADGQMLGSPDRGSASQNKVVKANLQ
jgi:hypothetical protein